MSTVPWAYWTLKMRSCSGLTRTMDVLLVSKEMKITKALSGSVFQPCTWHNIVQYHWLECYGIDSGNKVRCSCIYNLFAWYEWKKGDVILYSHQTNHRGPQRQNLGFPCLKKSTVLVTNLIYSKSQLVSWPISYALSQISMRYCSNSLKRCRLSLLCFCKYTIISLAMIPTILTLTPVMEISLWESSMKLVYLRALSLLCCLENA